ncbi:MAG: TlpA family protein disulfide reductase [Thioalkalivibrio sp.]|nr:TlpA family protein disulfide reductase [Thioalkalivibrio sp.]
MRVAPRAGRALALLAVGIVGCNPGSDRPPSADGFLSAGAIVDSFVAPDVDGTVQAVRFPSPSVVVLQVGAFDCDLCRQQWEAMRQVADQMAPSDLRMIAVTLDDVSRDEAIADWAREAGQPFEIWRDHERRIADVVGMDGIPRLLVIGKDGEVLHRERGVPTGITPRWVSALTTAIGKDIPFVVAGDSDPSR